MLWYDRIGRALCHASKLIVSTGHAWTTQLTTTAALAITRYFNKWLLANFVLKVLVLDGVTLKATLGLHLKTVLHQQCADSSAHTHIREIFEAMPRTYHKYLQRWCVSSHMLRQAPPVSRRTVSQLPKGTLWTLSAMLREATLWTYTHTHICTRGNER